MMQAGEAKDEVAPAELVGDGTVDDTVMQEEEDNLPEQDADHAQTVQTITEETSDYRQTTIPEQFPVDGQGEGENKETGGVDDDGIQRPRGKKRRRGEDGDEKEESREERKRRKRAKRDRKEAKRQQQEQQQQRGRRTFAEVEQEQMPAMEREAAAEAEVNLDGPRLLTDEEKARNERIAEHKSRMQPDAGMDWNRIEQEDAVFARQLAILHKLPNPEQFAEEHGFCLPCRLRARVKIDGWDPYNDLSTMVKRNYGRCSLEAFLNEMQYKYVTGVVAWNKAEARFWYRKCIYKHIRIHSPSKIPMLFDRIRQLDAMFDLATEFVCEFDVPSQMYSFNTKMIDPIKKIAECSHRVYTLLAKENALEQSV